MLSRWTVLSRRPKRHSIFVLTKGNDNPSGQEVLVKRGYRSHIRLMSEEKPKPRDKKKLKPQHGVVKRMLGWLSQYYEILVRYDKH